MPMLQAMTHLHHPQQAGMGILQPHSAGLDFITHQGPMDPHQHLQQAMQHSELTAEVPKRRNRKRDELDPTKYAVFLLARVRTTPRVSVRLIHRVCLQA